jgi:hypothetical protein
MPFTFVDRVPSKLGRVKITPENGGAAYYAIMERADEPATAGTPLSAANLNAAQENLVYQDTTSAHTFKRVYVATNGNDNNTGASTSVPMKTVRGAIRKYAKWHKYLDLYLADGTYTEDIGTISTDNCSMSIRSTSESMDKVTINIATMLESHINQFRLYNLTLNMTASNTRVLSCNAGQMFVNNVRINMPTSSTAACVNVYNGASIFLSSCIINPGTGAAIYGNQGLWIRAYKCTSERTVPLAYYANNGTVIEYTNSMAATQLTKQENGGKCILLESRAGSIDGEMGALRGQYMTYDGLLMQWGTMSISPTGNGVPTSTTVTFPLKYNQTPLVFAQAVTSVPEECNVGVRRDAVDDPKEGFILVLTRFGTTPTVINWFAIGTGVIAT